MMRDLLGRTHAELGIPAYFQPAYRSLAFIVALENSSWITNLADGFAAFLTMAFIS